MAGLVFAYFLCFHIAIKYLFVRNKLMLGVERLFCLNNQLKYVVLAQPKNSIVVEMMKFHQKCKH